MSIIKNSIENQDKLPDFFDMFDEEITYPNNLAETGILPNHYYNIVSCDFIQGYVNHIDIKYVIMMERFTEFDEGKINKFIEYLNKGVNTNYRHYVHLEDDVLDDIILFGESKNDYWILWSDSSARPAIGRIGKHRCKDVKEFRDSFIKFAVTDDYKKYVELPIPKQWITL